jgi:hypothetical protein
LQTEDLDATARDLGEQQVATQSAHRSEARRVDDLVPRFDEVSVGLRE